MKICKTLKEAKEEAKKNKENFPTIKKYSKDCYIVYDYVDEITMELLEGKGIMGVYYENNVITKDTLQKQGKKVSYYEEDTNIICKRI